MNRQSAAKPLNSIEQEESSTTISMRESRDLINLETEGCLLSEWQAIPVTSGIYCITNIINNKVYIGISKNLKKRAKEHFYLFKGYKIKGGSKLKNAFKKYKITDFKFNILEITNVKLIEKESFYIKKFNSVKNGYNIKEYDEYYKETYKHTPEAIEKGADSHRLNILVFNFNGELIDKIRGIRVAATKYNYNRRTLNESISNNTIVINENRKYFYRCRDLIFIKESEYDSREILYKKVRDRHISRTPYIAIERCKKKISMIDIENNKVFYFNYIKEMLIALKIPNTTYHVHKNTLNYKFNNKYTINKTQDIV